MLVIYYITLLPSLCTRLSDMCMDVETKLKQVPIRSTRSIDVDRDEAMRAVLANAAVVGAMDQTRLQDLIAYAAACNSNQGMGWTLNFQSGSFVLRTTTLYQAAGTVLSILVVLAAGAAGAAGALDELSSAATTAANLAALHG